MFGGKAPFTTRLTCKIRTGGATLPTVIPGMSCEARPRRERNKLLREIEMAVDIFLRLSGIDGESIASGHAKEIDILSWSWGMTNKITFVTGGLGSGKAQAGELSFMHWVDRSTPE